MKVNRVWTKPTTPASTPRQAPPRPSDCAFCRATRNTVKLYGKRILGIREKR